LNKSFVHVEFVTYSLGVLQRCHTFPLLIENNTAFEIYSCVHALSRYQISHDYSCDFWYWHQTISKKKFRKTTNRLLH